MTSLGRLPRSPAAPSPPLEDDDLLWEILLRLPPQPSSLPRASIICKRWHRLVTDQRFVRHFRRHHRRSPPLLGFFEEGSALSFHPTLDAPNRVLPGRFSLQCDHLLGCRHGLVLMVDRKRKQVLVWDPVTGDQHRIAIPPRFFAESTLTNGAVLRTAGDVHFQVVLVVVVSDDELHGQVLACVYSSETGLWSNNLMSTPLPFTGDFPAMVSIHMPAVLTGDSLYWNLIGLFYRILKFDLARQTLAFIQLPPDVPEKDHKLMVVPAEGGGLGFLLLSESGRSAQLWKRKTDCDSVASWELKRTIELDKLLSLNSEESDYLIILGFAECNNVVFLWTFTGVFMVELESVQFKKVSGINHYCKPFESVYAAGHMFTLSV